VYGNTFGVWLFVPLRIGEARHRRMSRDAKSRARGRRLPNARYGPRWAKMPFVHRHWAGGPR
jgi:hypothetical protein